MPVMRIMPVGLVSVPIAVFDAAAVRISVTITLAFIVVLVTAGVALTLS